MILLRVLRIVVNTAVFVLLAPLTFFAMLIFSETFRQHTLEEPTKDTILFFAFTFILPLIYVVCLIGYLNKPFGQRLLEKIREEGLMHRRVSDTSLLYYLRSCLFKGRYFMFLQKPFPQYVATAYQFKDLLEKVTKPKR